MVPLNFGKVHRNQNGSRQIWTWKWFVQNEDVLIRFRAGFNSSKAHRSQPRWLVSHPWSGGGTRSSYSRVSNLTSPELKCGSVVADRGSRGLQQAGLSWGGPASKQFGLQMARQSLGRASSGCVSCDSGRLRRYRLVRWGRWGAVLRRGPLVGRRNGQIFLVWWCTVTSKVSIGERERWWREEKKN